jgi:Fe-S-cluster-containing hydrogenase component 2
MAFVLRAFLKGVDGVFIGACHLNECNYTTHGNYQALSMVNIFKKIMQNIGLNPERLTIGFQSGSEANLFVENVGNFVKKVKALGPLGKGEGIDGNELKSKLEAVNKLIPYIKLVKMDKLALRLDKEEEYDELFTSDEIDQLFREVISYHIDPDKCRACMICLKKCPVEAIVGGKNRIHVIDQEKCIKCGTCFDACPTRFGAVKKISGEPVPPSIPEEERTLVRVKKNENNSLSD